MRIAVTADLHWGHQARGLAATRLLIEYLETHPPDLLLLAGDIGTGSLYGDCLAQLSQLPGLKAVVPGNHDIWVLEESARDSLALYDEELPRVSAQHRFHYLDQKPLILADAGLAIVGSINWYDYSWSLEKLRSLYPEELHRLDSKRFTRGRHNDANFVRWPLDDAGFTARVVAAFERNLLLALEQVPRVIAVTHHPPIYALGFPRPFPTTSLDGLLWDAFCGNRAMEELFARHAERIAFVFCGHTHRAVETQWHGIRGYNVGSDYHFKRLLLLDWPAGTVEAHHFGEPQE
jgi:3',5'-cyclic AMP phosphodiesterase CpdA